MAREHDETPPSPPPEPVPPRLTPRDVAEAVRALAQYLHAPAKVVVHAAGRRRGPHPRPYRPKGTRGGFYPYPHPLY
jgi:hypothetical protein